MQPIVWNIDAAHSGISFTVRHMVFAKVRGNFTKLTGKLELDEAKKPLRAQVSIEAASITTGIADRDTHLRSADFLDVEQHPSLGFVSKSVQAAGSGYRVTGDLTIRGVTREVVLDAEYSGQGKDPWGNERVGFSAKTSIERSDFGLKWNQALEAGGVLVGEHVDIELEVQAVQAAKTQAA